jgi:hypothetical protein
MYVSLELLCRKPGSGLLEDALEVLGPDFAGVLVALISLS